MDKKIFLNISMQIAKDTLDRRALEDERALNTLKEIVKDEGRIELVEFEEDEDGNRQPADYEGSISSNGDKHWMYPEDCKIVCMYEEDGEVYGRIYDENETPFDIKLGMLDFDAVAALMQVCAELL